MGQKKKSIPVLPLRIHPSTATGSSTVGTRLKHVTSNRYAALRALAAANPSPEEDHVFSDDKERSDDESDREMCQSENDGSEVEHEKVYAKGKKRRILATQSKNNDPKRHRSAPVDSLIGNTANNCNGVKKDKDTTLPKLIARTTPQVIHNAVLPPKLKVTAPSPNAKRKIAFGKDEPNSSDKYTESKSDESNDVNIKTESLPPKNKGLKNFALRVADEVYKKQRTTYADVADGLVESMMKDINTDGSLAQLQGMEDMADEDLPNNASGTKRKPKKPQKRDSKGDDLASLLSRVEKNIRRRVYDAINVLLAVGIFEKEKQKQISWRGYSNYQRRIRDTHPASRFAKPSDSQEEGDTGEDDTDSDPVHGDSQEYHDELDTFKNRMTQKRKKMEELELRMAALQRLVDINRNRRVVDQDKIFLPLVVLDASARAMIDIEMDEVAENVHFELDSPFQIHSEEYLVSNMTVFGMPSKYILNEESRILIGRHQLVPDSEYDEGEDLNSPMIELERSQGSLFASPPPSTIANHSRFLFDIPTATPLGLRGSDVGPDDGMMSNSYMISPSSRDFTPVNSQIPIA